MSKSENRYNLIKENIIYVGIEFKQKGKIYGIITLTKEEIILLSECIGMMSETPQISPKFSIRIEKFLHPRFDELIRIIYADKSFPSEVGIEFSKENNEDIVKGFETIYIEIREKGYSVEELRNKLKKMKYSKYK